MNFGSDMMSDQAYDALAIGSSKQFTAVSETFAQAVDPEPPIGIEHDLDNLRVCKPGCDRRTHRGAQHSCPA